VKRHGFALDVELLKCSMASWLEKKMLSTLLIRMFHGLDNGGLRLSVVCYFLQHSCLFCLQVKYIWKSKEK